MSLRLSTATMFAVSCSVLLLEVSLTRIFSFVMWYHLTYLVISLALLGYGAAGTMLARNKRLRNADYRSTLAYLCFVFSIVTVVAVYVGATFPTEPEKLFEGHYAELVTIALTHLTLAIPFFIAGTAIGLVLMRNRTATNELYAADLFGAGLGSLLSVLIINELGAVSAVFIAALLPAVVGFFAAQKRWKIAQGAVVIALVSAAIVSRWHDMIPLTLSGGKELTTHENDVVYRKWNIVSRIDVTRLSMGMPHFGGRVSETYTGPVPEVLGILQDATAPTGIIKVTRDVREDPLFGAYLQSAPYHVRRKPEAVLIIGLGGGTDALIAEHAGAAHVTGVDVNPVTMDLLENRYRGWASGLFALGNLRTVVSEGRHFVTTSEQKFDVIQLSGVDTFAALSAGSMVLTENYLYTEEAIRDLLAHVTDRGLVSYSRWLFDPPRETLKLVVTASSELRKLGVDKPAEHFVVVAGGPRVARWADTIIGKSALRDDELAVLRAWASEMGFEILYDPFMPKTNPFDTFIRGSATEQKQFAETYLYDVSPSTDDRPFFFQFYRWRSAFHPSAAQGVGGYAPVQMPKGLLSMVLTLVELVVLSVLLVLVPLRGESIGVSRKRALSWMVKFGGLGLGFIAVEMVLMQKLSVFLGGPAYSMAVTLFALLVFSGLGSRIAKRVGAPTKMLAALLVAQIVELAFLDFGVPGLFGLPHAVRIAVAIVAIAPLGITMGMTFPTLLAEAGEESEALIPWAWGVNACATVVGSVLAVMGSLELGFNVTWLVAMSIYAAVLAMTLRARA